MQRQMFVLASRASLFALSFVGALVLGQSLSVWRSTHAPQQTAPPPEATPPPVDTADLIDRPGRLTISPVSSTPTPAPSRAAPPAPAARPAPATVAVRYPVATARPPSTRPASSTRSTSVAPIAVVPIPPYGNEWLSPDGRYVGSDSAIYDLRGVLVAHTDARPVIDLGWLPDASALVIALGRAGSADSHLALLMTNGTTVNLELPFVQSPPFATSDAKWLAIVSGGRILLSSADGKVTRTLVTSGAAVTGEGWLDDSHFLYVDGPNYRVVDLSSRIEPFSPPPSLRGGFALLPSPDGKAALLFASGPSSPLTAAFVTRDKVVTAVDVQTYVGWVSAHELLVRRGGELAVLDLETARTRTVANGIDSHLSFPLLASPRGPLPIGAGVRDGLACWHSGGALLTAVALADGATATLAGRGTVLGVAQANTCVTIEPNAHALIDMRALLRR